MSHDVIIRYINEVRCLIETKKEILYDLKDKFSFHVEGYKFHPKYKAGVWDGKISMFNKDGLLYNGLIIDVIKYCKTKGYTVKVENVNAYNPDVIEDTLISDVLKDCILTPYDYQIASVKKALSRKKLLVLSPTGSGKSLLLFMFYKFCLLNNIKMLITVPSTSLAEQLKSDFKDYVGTEKEHLIDESVATLYAGQDKNPDVPCIISTWQTCSKMPQEWLEQFGFYACDEAHGADATEITKIIDALGNCKYRIGLTGTLDGSHLHELEMKARFGSVFKMVTTRELIDRGILTEIAIKSLKLNYHKEERKLFHKVVQKKYQREIDYLIEHEHRNKLILNTAMEAEGNTLMLFNRIEGHGMVLYKEIEDMCERAGKRLYMIHGKIKPTEREIIRKKMDEKPELFGRKLTIDGFVYHFRLDEDLKLVNGLSKNVKDINIDDDIDIDWLVSNQEKYKDFKR